MTIENLIFMSIGPFQSLFLSFSNSTFYRGLLRSLVPFFSLRLSLYHSLTQTFHKSKQANKQKRFFTSLSQPLQRLNVAWGRGGGGGRQNCVVQDHFAAGKEEECELHFRKVHSRHGHDASCKQTNKKKTTKLVCLMSTLGITFS